MLTLFVINPDSTFPHFPSEDDFTLSQAWPNAEQITFIRDQQYPNHQYGNNQLEVRWPMLLNKPFKANRGYSKWISTLSFEYHSMTEIPKYWGQHSCVWSKGSGSSSSLPQCTSCSIILPI
jgi:hypothetical protein